MGTTAIYLKRYDKYIEKFMNHTVTDDETQILHKTTETNRQSTELCYSRSPTNPKMGNNF